jgi:hypothetical protein
VGKYICYLYIRQRIGNRIYKELKNLNSPKINESIKKWAIELNFELPLNFFKGRSPNGQKT